MEPYEKEDAGDPAAVQVPARNDEMVLEIVVFHELHAVVLLGEETPGQVPVHVTAEDEGLDLRGSHVSPALVARIDGSAAARAHGHLTGPSCGQLPRPFHQEPAKGAGRPFEKFTSV